MTRHRKSHPRVPLSRIISIKKQSWQKPTSLKRSNSIPRRKFAGTARINTQAIRSHCETRAVSFLLRHHSAVAPEQTVTLQEMSEKKCPGTRSLALNGNGNNFNWCQSKGLNGCPAAATGQGITKQLPAFWCLSPVRFIRVPE